MKLQSKITLMIIIFLSFIFSVFSCGYAWINNDQSLLFIILVILVHMAVLYSVFDFLKIDICNNPCPFQSAIKFIQSSSTNFYITS